MMLSGSTFAVFSLYPLILHLYLVIQEESQTAGSTSRLFASLDFPSIHPNITLFISIFGRPTWFSSSPPFFPTVENNLVAFEFMAAGENNNLNHGYTLLVPLSTLFGFFRDFESHPDGHCLSWDEWGPQSTWLIPSIGHDFVACGCVSGSRFGRSIPDPSSGTGVSLEIFDFSRLAAQYSWSLDKVPNAPPSSNEESAPVIAPVMHRHIIEHSETIGPNELLDEAVTTSLPYVLTTTPWPFDISYEFWFDYKHMLALKVCQSILFLPCPIVLTNATLLACLTSCIMPCSGCFQRHDETVEAHVLARSS